jgi:nucleotide-binding universal stress UspA family protein
MATRTKEPRRSKPSSTVRVPSLAILQDVLCGVDGTRSSYEAVRQAASLAGPQGRLTLLAVVGGYNTEEQRRRAAAQDAATPSRPRRSLEYARRLAKLAGVPAEASLEAEGSIADTLMARAREHSLLAIGAPALSRGAELVIGGVTAAAVHTLPVSLLVAKRARNAVGEGEQIVVASDASERSEALVDLAAALARERGASLALVHAAGAESRSQPTRLSGQVERVGAVAGVDETLGARSIGRALSHSASVHIEPGRAHRLIVQTASQAGASLIVMGSRRPEGLRALGSVSERVVHEAPCSVLVVRPEDLER